MEKHHLDFTVQRDDLSSDYLHVNYNRLVSEGVRVWVSGHRISLTKDETGKLCEFLQTLSKEGMK